MKSLSLYNYFLILISFECPSPSDLNMTLLGVYFVLFFLDSSKIFLWFKNCWIKCLHWFEKECKYCAIIMSRCRSISNFEQIKSRIATKLASLTSFIFTYSVLISLFFHLFSKVSSKREPQTYIFCKHSLQKKWALYIYMSFTWHM